MDPVQTILEGPPPSVFEQVWEGIESVYDSVGLMSGDAAPSKRLLFGGLVGAGITYLIAPKFAFDKDGKPRPWALTAPRAPNKTTIPWYMPGVALGLFSGLFI